ncbi:MAG: pilin [Gammaproteobacteria bacterium]|jgi:type IV pilus assembly protein PilA
MKITHQGFTLIELMIVTAIIGVLASIAIPFYKNYTSRAHVSEGLSLASPAKAAVWDYYAAVGEMPSNNIEVGLPDPVDIAGNSVTSITVGSNGIVTILYNAKVDSSLTKNIILTPVVSEGSIMWSCSGSVPSKYRPSACRS